VHKITVIALKGYREWTESLGARREHIIQKHRHVFKPLYGRRLQPWEPCRIISATIFS